MSRVCKNYWDETWATSKMPCVVNPHVAGLRNYPKRCWHKYFSEVFADVETRKMKLLEIGCARSVWLPYFAKEFGFQIYGLDYSEIGCQQERQVLVDAGVKGEVVCADFFSPPEDMLETFDVVVSFGVAEHFEDTADCIQSFSKFLKPNGIVITVIPNMVGLIGWLQKLINQPIFDIHVLLDSMTLAEAHEVSGLRVVECNYFMSTHFGVCNLNGIQSGSMEWFIKNNILLFFISLSVASWLFESKIGSFKQNKLTSPYINCVAVKS